jgi:hypothetical protein
MKASDYRNERIRILHIYRKKARYLFWIHWLSAFFGHFGIVLSLHFLFGNKIIFLAPIAWILFRYYLLAMGKLRRKRMPVSLAYKGYKQESAEEIIASGKKYAVYLRGFKHEHFSRGSLNLIGGFDDTETLGIKANAGYVEELLTKFLKKEICVIALSNPTDQLLWVGVHRFLHSPDNWEDFLKNLLPNSTVIFFYLTDITDAIIKEEAMLANAGCLNKTIVIGRASAALKFENEYRYFIPHDEKLGFTNFNEIKFRWRLRKCLRAFEKNTNQKGKILRLFRIIPMKTPSRLQLMFGFLFNTIFWFSLILIFLVKVFYNDVEAYELPIADIGVMAAVYALLRNHHELDKHGSRRSAGAI